MLMAFITAVMDAVWLFYW